MTNNQAASFQYYIQRFEEIKSDAKAFLLPLDERIFRRQPTAKTWCIGECFSHLVEAGTLYYSKVEEGMQRAGKNSLHEDKNPMQLRFHIQWFVNYLNPPVSFKTKAPRPFQPREYATLDKEKVLTDFLDLQDKYLSQLKLAKRKNLNLSNIKVSNPLISFIKMTVGECIAITEAHQRRHLEQARHTLKLIEDTL